MAARTLSTRALNRALLARQLLLQRKRLSVPQAVHALAGLQSQEPRDPHVALWSRLSGFTSLRLHTAAAKREVVRGTLLRGTIHTVSAEDYLAFRRLLQPVLDRELKAHAHLAGGFEMPALEAAARELLARGPLNAQQIGEALGATFPKAGKEGLARWVRTCIPLAMVPGDERWGYSRPPRFLPADDWLGEALSQATPLSALLLRGLAAMGPASAADLRCWCGLGGTAKALEDLRPQLRTFQDEQGRELFDLPQAPRPRADTPAPARLLPEYDNCLLSHEDRTRIVPAEHAARFAMGPNGRRPRAVLVDGFVRAGWQMQVEKGLATLSIEPFERLSADAVQQVEEVADALVRFMEPDADRYAVTWLTVPRAR
ncbi:winged helix DNA-binding domain-containing protein [Ideonella sp. BN130291]|uniref:winged helix DNA-binding domain-containing protein n=1 Tax=Ideonella sp. BN130291 TaxID=3112940 RepID=UPI002E26EF20|nr:winged helix DNA-binding domain-containing protein [Ideonella sp. BN130291]